MKELDRVIGIQKIRSDHKNILEPLLIFTEVCTPVSGLAVFVGF